MLDINSRYEQIRDIVYGKLVDKTIDSTYEDLSEQLFGDGNCFCDTEVRKRMYGMKAVIDAVEEENYRVQPDCADDVKCINDKMVELAKEKQKFFDQRREFNKLITKEGREEHILSILRDAALSLSDNVDIDFGKPDDVKSDLTHKESIDRKREAVIVFGDWHYGMKANNVFNVYDTNVCKQRVEAVVHNAIDRIKLNKCWKAHVVILGDMINGAIHTSARVASEEDICDQLMEVSEIIARAVIEISKCVDYTEVHCTYGNHARTVQNKKDSVHSDNMEKIIPWWLELRFDQYMERNDLQGKIRVDKYDSKEFIFVNACGHEICAAHGDLDFVGQSTRLLPTLFQKKYGKNIEYIILGDKHHRESFEELGVTSTICGSLCGTDDYANDRRLFSTPSQLLIIVDRDYGVDAEYRLSCIK